MLAALDNNHNVGREQAVVTTGKDKGKPRYNIVAPKGRKGWVAKEIYEKKDYSYVQEMCSFVIELCKTGGQGAPKMTTRDLPKNIAPEDKPLKEEMVQRHRSRFSKR